MKKKNILITLTSTMALLCIGGAFALNAGNSVSAETPSQQKMLGASILVANDKTGIDSNGIRFPVVVADEVAEKITESKVYVLPKDHWEGVEAPTAEQVKANGTAFDTTEKWVNYYEQDTGYGDEYSEAVVYMYNIPTSKYATDFYVCSQLTLEGGATDTSEVIGRSMTYVAQKAVESGAYSTDDLGNYIQATYKVNKYLRTVYGSYELTGESTTVEGVAGEIPTVDGVDGYTINATLTAQANPELYDGATLNFYYENDEFTFSQQEIGMDGNGVHTNLTYEKRAMTNVSPENLRGNTYYYKKTVNDGATWSKFEYDNSSLGKYLMLNTYYLSTWSSEPGVCFVAWTSEGSTVTDKILVKSYSDEGKFIDGTLIDYATAGNWITIVLYMDPAVLGANSTSMRLSFTSWTKNELYIGEYTYLTEDQFKTYYEQPFVAPEPEEIISEVTKYGTGNVENSNNLASINGITSYAKGSRVIVSAKASVAAPVKMYAGDGSTKLSANLIYTEDGKQVTAVEANKTYYYVFYIDDAEIKVGSKAGKVFVDTATTFTVEYGDAYTTKDQMGLSKFRFKVFEENGIEGIEFHAPNRIGRYDSGTGSVTRQADGTYLYEPGKYTWDTRTFNFDDKKSHTKGTFLVFKLKFVDTAPSAMLYQYDDYWNCRPWYTEDKTYIGWDRYGASRTSPSATTAGLLDYEGQWLWASNYLRQEVPSISKYVGSFTFATDAKIDLEAGKSPKVYIGGIYIMTEDAYKKFFNITTEKLY